MIINDIELNKDKFTYDELMLIWFSLSKPFIVFKKITGFSYPSAIAFISKDGIIENIYVG